METTLLIFAILAVTTVKVCALEVESVECGTTNVIDTRITKGDTTVRGQYPFLAALYLSKTDTFFCGGTLLSARHVLTAGHCMRQKQSNNTLLPADIVVVLGAYDLASKIEKGVQRRDVDKINIHPEWRAYSDNYDANLAILHLSEIVLFTNYIRPVCLPAKDRPFDDIRGSVVGWGRTENSTGPNKEFIKQASVTALYGVVEDQIKNVANLSSPRTFFGRGANGNANAGGSFLRLFGSSWMQYGIDSAMRSNATEHVDENTIVVYTNVFKFKDWIDDIVSQSDGAVTKVKTNVETKINLECTFKYSKAKKYRCCVDNLNIQSVAVTSFTGTHKNEKTDEDVEVILFRNGTMFFIPLQVGRTFKNLTIMRISENLSTKRIKRSDFQGLENLVILEIKKNNLTTLDCDSLKNLQFLEEFSLVENNITQIEFETFQTNVKLKKVWLRGNKIEILPIDLFTKNLLLEIVNVRDNSLKFIDETTFETNGQLTEVYLGGNSLEVVPSHLFTNNLRLELVGLDSNSLKIIDERIFETNVKLRQVWLNKNKIEILPTGLFTKNLLLENVDLAGNNLKIIDDTTFQTNIQLKQIHLSHNQLESLPRYLLSNNLLLEYVNLNGNSLKIIETDFTTFSFIKKIFLYYNTCIMAYFEDIPIKYLYQYNNLTVLQNIIISNCSSPIQ